MKNSQDGLNKAWNQVKDFHKAFGHPVSEKPKMLETERLTSRANWIIEEVNELLEAKTVTDQADACIDAIYFLLGNLVEMGVEPQPLFDIVQGANMAKLFPDGTPHYREDGKVIKPEGWEAPEPKLEAEIKRQLGN